VGRKLSTDVSPTSTHWWVGRDRPAFGRNEDADAHCVPVRAGHSSRPREHGFRPERGPWPMSWPARVLHGPARPSIRSPTPVLRGEARRCYLSAGGSGRKGAATSNSFNPHLLRDANRSLQSPNLLPLATPRRAAGCRDGAQGRTGGGPARSSSVSSNRDAACGSRSSMPGGRAWALLPLCFQKGRRATESWRKRRRAATRFEVTPRTARRAVGPPAEPFP